MAGIIDLDGSGDYLMEVVGESHYQTVLAAICGGRTREGHQLGVKARLIHDSKNPHDSQPIKVEIAGKTVGYLSRERAREYRRKLAAAGFKGRTAECDAMIAGGWDRGQGDKGDFGVRLDIGTRS